MRPESVGEIAQLMKKKLWRNEAFHVAMRFQCDKYTINAHFHTALYK